MSYETRTQSLIVIPEGKPIFSEMATKVAIEDESGGEFIVVSQDGMPGMGKIAFEPTEWPSIREAIDQMIKECRV
jgi:hypothetical protein